MASNLYDPLLLQTLLAMVSRPHSRGCTLKQIELLFSEPYAYQRPPGWVTVEGSGLAARARRYVEDERSLYLGLGWPTQWSSFEFGVVGAHLRLLESMGLLVSSKLKGAGQSECWRMAHADDFAQHMGDSPMLGVVQRAEELSPFGLPNGDGNGGSRGRDGGDGGRNNGNGGGNNDGQDDGPGGGGIGEVLAHPVLFALPRDDFETLLNNLFTGPGAP
ncbi:MAG: hypothetical protein RJB60_188 [Pseudomonadota bacterium]|jgi:hypothetical protein